MRVGRMRELRFVVGSGCEDEEAVRLVYSIRKPAIAWSHCKARSLRWTRIASRSLRRQTWPKSAWTAGRMLHARLRVLERRISNSRAADELLAVRSGGLAVRRDSKSNGQHGSTGCM